MYQTSPAEFVVDFRAPMGKNASFQGDISKLWKRISMRWLKTTYNTLPETNNVWFWKFDEHRQNTKISQEGKSSEPNSLLFRDKLAITLVPGCDLYTFFLRSYEKIPMAGESVNHPNPGHHSWAQAMCLGVGDRLHCQARAHQWMEGGRKTDSPLGNQHEGDKAVMDLFPGGLTC